MGLLVRRKVTGTTRWPFVFLGEAFEAVSCDASARALPEFGFQCGHGPVGLVRPEHGERHRPGHHVSDLQALGVGSLVGHHQLEGQRVGQVVAAFADAPELEFKLGIFPLAPGFDDEMDEALSLTQLCQQAMHTLQAKQQGQVVGIGRGGIREVKLAFVDDHDDEPEIGRFDDLREFVQERLAGFFAHHGESARLFADVMLVQDDQIMPERPDLQPPKLRRHLVDVGCLRKHAKSQRKERKVRIDRRHPMIPALVHEDEVVAKGIGRQIHGARL
jgi:hypothetical protein